MNVIDYSLLVQSALPGCGRSAQGAPFAQLSLRRVGVLQTNVRSFSGEVWQNLANLAKNKARDKTKRDYSLAQKALLRGEKSAQSAPLAQLALRLCALLLSRKMRTLAKDFHRCCKNLPSAGEKKSRYSVFISRLRPGKRFSGIYTHPKRDPALKRENFADSRKSSLAGRRSPESLRWFVQDHPVRSGLSRRFLRGAAARLHRVRDEMMILRK